MLNGGIPDTATDTCSTLSEEVAFVSSVHSLKEKCDDLKPKDSTKQARLIPVKKLPQAGTLTQASFVYGSCFQEEDIRTHLLPKLSHLSVSLQSFTGVGGSFYYCSFSLLELFPLLGEK